MQNCNHHNLSRDPCTSQRSQQLHAIAPAHQPRGGGLGIVPLLLIPPPISDSGAGGLDRWWGWGLTLGARAAANNDLRPWKWEVDDHGGGIYYGGEHSNSTLDPVARLCNFQVHSQDRP